MTENDSQKDSLIANIEHIKQVNNASIFKVIEKHAPIYYSGSKFEPRIARKKLRARRSILKAGNSTLAVGT